VTCVDDEPYNNGEMAIPPRASPEEALDWCRKMMSIYTPESAREFQQMVKDHEQVIMGGWDRRQRKYFPGLLVTLDNYQRQLWWKFFILGVVVLGSSAPSWWPFIRSMFP